MIQQSAMLELIVWSCSLIQAFELTGTSTALCLILVSDSSAICDNPILSVYDIRANPFHGPRRRENQIHGSPENSRSVEEIRTVSVSD